ncbi:uncharacterized protein [Oscarella lobularis]|uniref:uncharacterized protein n=1 Tax=Oscarella lobularis TaxID=121494 RepID=UPI003313BEB5
MANDGRRRLDVLRDYYTHLSRTLRVNNAFLGYLFQERVISRDEYEELSSDKHTTARKIRLLVMDYLLRGPDDDLDKIITALRVSEQEHLAERLQSLDEREILRRTPGPDPNVEIGGGTNQRQDLLPSSPSQCAATATAVVAMPQAADKLYVTVEIVDSLKATYERHKSSITSALKTYLKEACSKNNENYEVILWEITCDELFRIEEPMEQAGTVSFDQPKIRIIFPDVYSAEYETNHERVVLHLSRVMRLRKQDMEIDVGTGSIILMIRVPGEGLINMLIHLEQDAEPLSFLLELDKSAKIGFCKLPCVSISAFGRKELQKEATLPRATKERQATKKFLYHLHGGKRSADTILTKLPTEAFLCDLAEQSQNDWQAIARKLGFGRAEIGAIEKNAFNDVKEQCIRMFCRWLNRKGSAGTLAVLKDAYKDAELIGQFETAVKKHF